MRVCTACGTRKPLTEFYASQPSSRCCKACFRADQQRRNCARNARRTQAREYARAAFAGRIPA